jgi:uncharacterized protein YecE (DUF72 family)
MPHLPSEVRFGTSSWAYEGWQGLVYHKPYLKSRFSRDCLAEYAAHAYRGVPLFRTVGIDHTFYRPPSVGQLAHYAAQLPPGFLVCSKVWEELTIPVYAKHARYGLRGGKGNPAFLSIELFKEAVLAPTHEGLGAYAGPFIFEFQRSGLDPETFLGKLDGFLEVLPAGPQYAVEVRNPAILGERYRDILTAHRVAHVYNHWTAMPPLTEQHTALGRRFTAAFAMVRLLTPLGLSYEKAVERATPYDKLVQPLPRMRVETMDLVRQSADEHRPIFVLVNNRAEGSAPLTVQALVDQLLGSEAEPGAGTGPPASPSTS